MLHSTWRTRERQSAFCSSDLAPWRGLRNGKRDLVHALYGDARLLLAYRGCLSLDGQTSDLPEGAAIATMHYVGMAAMRLRAMHHYDRALWRLSIALAVVISFAGPLILHCCRDETRNWKHKCGTTLAVGMAIPIMQCGWSDYLEIMVEDLHTRLRQFSVPNATHIATCGRYRNRVLVVPPPVDDLR